MNKTFSITDAKFNASHELVSCAGIVLNDKGKMNVEKSDMELVKWIKNLPRVEEYNGGNSVKVKVDGVEWKLGYKFFTDAEKQTYADYRGTHQGSGTSATSKINVPEHNKKVEALVALLTKAKASEDVLEAAKGLMLVDAQAEKKAREMAALKAKIAALTEEEKKALGLSA